MIGEPPDDVRGPTMPAGDAPGSVAGGCDPTAPAPRPWLWLGRPLGPAGCAAAEPALPAAARSAALAAEDDEEEDGGANRSGLIVPCGLPTGEAFELLELPPPWSGCAAFRVAESGAGAGSLDAMGDRGSQSLVGDGAAFAVVLADTAELPAAAGLGTILMGRITVVRPPTNAGAAFATTRAAALARDISARLRTSPPPSELMSTFATRGIPRLTACRFKGSVINDLCSSAWMLPALNARRVRRRSVKLRRRRDMVISKVVRTRRTNRAGGTKAPGRDGCLYVGKDSGRQIRRCRNNRGEVRRHAVTGRTREPGIFT